MTELNDDAMREVAEHLECDLDAIKGAVQSRLQGDECKEDFAEWFSENLPRLACVVLATQIKCCFDAEQAYAERTAIYRSALATILVVCTCVLIWLVIT